MTMETTRAVPRSSQSATRSREALWATAAGALLTIVFCAYYFQHTWVMNEADPRLLSEYTGHRPYQFRVLLPFLLHVITHATSLNLAVCYNLLIMGFCLGLFFVFRLYLAEFCPPQAAQWLALGIIPTLFVFYSHLWFYLYDIPATFFATLGLLLMVRKNWVVYLVTFAIATFNRESTAFIALAFALAMGNELPRRQFAQLLAAQAGIWLGIKLFLSALFAGNPGKAVENQFANNLATLGSYIKHFQAPLGFVLTVALLVGLWFWGSGTKAYQPQFLRRVRGITGPFLVSMTFVGVLSETRLYGELIPVVLTPALVGFFGWSEARSHSLHAPHAAL